MWHLATVSAEEPQKGEGRVALGTGGEPVGLLRVSQRRAPGLRPTLLVAKPSGGEGAGAVRNIGCVYFLHES